MIRRKEGNDRRLNENGTFEQYFAVEFGHMLEDSKFTSRGKTTILIITIKNVVITRFVGVWTDGYLHMVREWYWTYALVWMCRKTKISKGPCLRSNDKRFISKIKGPVEPTNLSVNDILAKC